jgi:hypothetical protein
MLGKGLEKGFCVLLYGTVVLLFCRNNKTCTKFEQCSDQGSQLTILQYNHNDLLWHHPAQKTSVSQRYSSSMAIFSLNL